MTKSPGLYDAGRAASYWSGPRHETGNELAAVLSLGEPPAVNEAYDAWETGLLLDSLGAVAGELGLDIGTGVGRVALRVAPRVKRLACGDLAAGMLGRLRKNALRSGARNLDPLRLRSDRLPFRDGTFSVVLCLGLLEHLPAEARRATLEEAARVIRRDGVLALVLNNSESRFLGDPADNPYRDGLQRESGYFCAVVSERAIAEESGSMFEDRVLGSNLFYSLHRHAARNLPEFSRRDPRLAPFFERAAAWDRALRPVGPLARAAADHHLHLLVRK